MRILLILIAMMVMQAVHCQRKLPFELQGFINSRHALRTQETVAATNDFVLSEHRVQLHLFDFNKYFEYSLKSDFLYDHVLDKVRVDLREAHVDIATPHWLGLKVGRQILTWGKGDMLFINDLFPKEWQSFFIGREIEYLKAPSDAAKISFFVHPLELNIVYTPQFDSDIFPTGERLEFFDPFVQDFRYNENTLGVLERNRWFRDDELSWRLRFNIASVDIAFYGYYGYWKSPMGLDISSFQYTFPSLTSHGASVEANILGGVFAAEMGWYRSNDDLDGDDFTVENSSLRFLMGQRFDLPKSWTLAFQYYAEHMLQYDAFVSSLPPDAIVFKSVRNMLTARLEKKFLKDKLAIQLFNYYGIAERDNYLRYQASYTVNDHWKIDIGGNIFSGNTPYGFWSRFDNSSNIYLGIKVQY